MKTFSHQINTLYQFEISNLLSVEAPTMANSYLSLTNTGLYLTILCFSVSVLILYFIFKADKTQEVYMLREQWETHPQYKQVAEPSQPKIDIVWAPVKGISLTDVVTGKVQNNNNDYKIMFFDQRDRSGISITGLHHTKKNMHKAIIDGSETYGYLISTGGTKGVSSKKETNLIGVQAKWWESRSSTHSIESMFHPIAPNSAYDLLVRKSKIQVSMLQ